MAISTLQDFINKSHKVVELPGYEPGQTLTIKIKSVSLLGLASSGKIPNALMGTVNKLFNTAAPTTKGKAPGMDNIVELTQLMSLIAKHSLVEPTYEEVGEYLTDDQLSVIFDSAMSGVKEVTPSSGK